MKNDRLMMYGVIWDGLGVQLFQTHENGRRVFEQWLTRGVLKGAYFTENHWEAYACAVKMSKKLGVRMRGMRTDEK